ncbi:MAG TPA: hypothetical protein VFU12_01350 [Glycomyces sp.]|nr:hypothetical protein [Glycomyces sp.]
MDDFEQFAAGGEGPDDFGETGDMSDEGPSSPFDDWSESEVPDDEGDLESLGYDWGETGGEDQTGLEAGIDDAFDVDDDFAEDPPADQTGAGGEADYAATYEDALVAEADNPALFPPELDLDVPEPVDGYPWVDLDALGSAEAEPWVNTAESSDYAAADLDDVVAEALSRFWEQ